MKRMCGPTRSATLSGRLPYHVNQRNGNDINSTAGVDLRMTFLPAKLKQAGYRLVGLEQTDHSVCIYDYSFDRRTALVIGHERHGMSDDELAQEAKFLQPRFLISISKRYQ